MSMARFFSIWIATLLLLCATEPARAQSHVALVIGNSTYAAGQLPTVHDDAGVIAETLRGAGFDVTEADNVGQADIGPLMRAFLDKVAAAGPDAVAFVYYAGQAAQASNQNFLIPVDAQINGAADVPAQALRLGDLVDALAQLPAAARIIVLDASRDHGYGRGTPDPVAPGLAIMEVPAGMLVAFAAAPGQIAAESGSQYGLYTATLVTLMRQSGLDLDQVFKAARVQVNQMTGGKQTPWTAMGLTVDVTLFPAEPNAPSPQLPPPVTANVPNAPPVATIPPKGERVVTRDLLRQLTPDQAYQVAIEEDSLEVYQSFVRLFPDYSYAAQVWDLIGQRRDELLWSRAVASNAARAYWNYLKRYPNGIHATEAQEALDALNAQPMPPPDYQPQPVAPPPDYYDEGLGLAEIFPDGLAPPPPVFDDIPPEFAPPPPPPPVIIVRPPPHIVIVQVPKTTITTVVTKKPPVLVTPSPVQPPNVKNQPTTIHNHTGVLPPTVNKVPTNKPPVYTGPHKPETPKTPKIPGPGPHTPVTPPHIGPTIPPHTGPTPTIPAVPGPHTPETPPHIGPIPTIPAVPGPHTPETPPHTGPTIPQHTGPTPTIPPVPGPHTPATPPHTGPTPAVTPPPPHPVTPPSPPPHPVTPPSPPPKVVRPPPPPPKVVRPPPPPPKVVRPPPPPPKVVRPPPPPPKVVRPPPPPPRVVRPPPPPPRQPSCRMVNGKKVCS